MGERIFVDTNVFLRYLTNDVPAQAEAVEALLGRARNGDVSLVTNTIVIAEIVWTLESFYHLSAERIRDQVLAIANTPGLTLPERDVIMQAAVWYADEHVDFADAYSAAWMASQGISVAATFDRRHFRRLAHVEVRVPGED